MRRAITFYLGVILVAFGIALNEKSGLGQAPLDTLSFNLSLVCNLKPIYCIIIVNSLLIFIYFLLKPSKNIWILILSTILLSFSFNGLSNYVFIFEVNHLALKIVLFILANILIGFGVALQIFSKFCITALEGIILFIKEKFKKLSFGTTRVIVESFIILISSTLSLIFKHSFGSVGLATLIMLISSGYITDIFLKLISIFEVKKNDN